MLKNNSKCLMSSTWSQQFLAFSINVCPINVWPQATIFGKLSFFNENKCRSLRSQCSKMRLFIVFKYRVQKMSLGSIPNIPHCGEYWGILVFKFPIPHREKFVFPMGKIFNIFISKSPKSQIFFNEILSKCCYNLI